MVASAQSAINVGFAATLGTGWQIESGELGYVRGAHIGPLRTVALGVRLGSFIDEGAILGGARGFVAAGTLSARTGRAIIAEMGNEPAVTQLGVDLTFELSGYLASNSPLPQGGRWTAVAVLPGLRVGSGDGPRYGLVIGPTAFFGTKTEVRGLLAFRVEAPLARRNPHP